MHCLSGILLPDAGSVQLAAPGAAPEEVTVYGEEQRARLRREKLGSCSRRGCCCRS